MKEIEAYVAIDLEMHTRTKKGQEDLARIKASTILFGYLIQNSCCKFYLLFLSAALAFFLSSEELVEKSSVEIISNGIIDESFLNFWFPLRLITKHNVKFHPRSSIGSFTWKTER